jgi:hypothetical protein
MWLRPVTDAIGVVTASSIRKLCTLEGSFDVQDWQSTMNLHSAFAAAPPAMAGNIYLYSFQNPFFARSKSSPSICPIRVESLR